ncbi:MAG: hypothetical protein M1831_004558 [Alyxoria varia]|nr:MAG: hypothetical protein M1831_004558 [Alyxoria varia]
MGSNASKSQSSSQHVFTADTPVAFSENLVNSLQQSPETDSTRAKDLELQVQSRVTTELDKLLSQSREKLSSTSDSVSGEPFDSSSKSKTQSAHTPVSYTEKPLWNRVWDMFTGHESSAPGPGFRQDLDSSGVSGEIEELRKKLAVRKRTIELDDAVAKAKEGVVVCLRLNDRRPLDCWKEVETFKAEVGRLERQFVDSNSG